MVSNCTIIKKNGKIVLMCNIDDHRYVTFNELERNAILSGQPVHLTKTVIDLGQNVWEKRYNELKGE